MLYDFCLFELPPNFKFVEEKFEPKKKKKKMLSIFLYHQFLSKNTVKWEMSSRSLGAEVVASATTMIMVILIGDVMFHKRNNAV